MFVAWCMNARKTVANIVTHNWAIARIHLTSSTFIPAVKGALHHQQIWHLPVVAATTPKARKRWLSIPSRKSPFLSITLDKIDGRSLSLEQQLHGTDRHLSNRTGNRRFARLNRAGLRKLRQILYAANEHPPAPINDVE